MNARKLEKIAGGLLGNPSLLKIVNGPRMRENQTLRSSRHGESFGDGQWVEPSL